MGSFRYSWYGVLKIWRRFKFRGATGFGVRLLNELIKKL